MAGWFNGWFRNRRRVRIIFGPVLHALFPVEVFMSFQLQDSQKVELSASEVDAAGNPVTNGATFTFTSSDETLLKIDTESEPGKTFAVAVGPLGSVQLNVADNSTPATTGQATVDIVSGPAASVQIQFGTPVPK